MTDSRPLLTYLLWRNGMSNKFQGDVVYGLSEELTSALMITIKYCGCLNCYLPSSKNLSTSTNRYPALLHAGTKCELTIAA